MVASSRVQQHRRRHRKPRILICTPEVTELPEGMGNAANYIRAKGGGLGDISAGLIRHLFEDGRFQLHVVLPKYDHKFRDLAHFGARELDLLVPLLSRKGVHLVSDSAFSYLEGVYDEDSAHPRVRRAQAFQRHIINQLLDELQPDLVHANDWMTGLIPAAARAKGIKSLFTLHNVFTEKETPRNLDRGGIDVRRFINLFYFERYPHDSLDTWENNRIDFLASGLMGADAVNTVSKTFLQEIVEGAFGDLIPDSVREVVREKYAEGRAFGIINAPNDTVDPRFARHSTPYDEDDVMEKKRLNKVMLQERMGLRAEPDAPLFFWPSRLYGQKGPELLAAVAPRLIASAGIQVAVVANGDAAIERAYRLLAVRSAGRFAIRPFTEDLSELAKAGADFVLMPSRYEPCGLPQMEGPRFGTLPVARLTGGLRDTVQELDIMQGTGNGFVFEPYTSSALELAMRRAVEFTALAPEHRHEIIRRVMRESHEHFNLNRTAKAYTEIYESLLE
ncbi:MAG: glycogen/starch synthase [Myxococcota bacterium]